MILDVNQQVSPIGIGPWSLKTWKVSCWRSRKNIVWCQSYNPSSTVTKKLLFCFFQMPVIDIMFPMMWERKHVFFYVFKFHCTTLLKATRSLHQVESHNMDHMDLRKEAAYSDVFVQLKECRKRWPNKKTMVVVKPEKKWPNKNDPTKCRKNLCSTSKQLESAGFPFFGI